MRQDDYVLNFLLLDSGIRLALKTGRPLSLRESRDVRLRGTRDARVGARLHLVAQPSVAAAYALHGFGPDTFAMVFPQQDLTGKFRVYGTTDMLVDKVHNGLLQISAQHRGVVGVDTGGALPVVHRHERTDLFRRQSRRTQGTSRRRPRLPRRCHRLSRCQSVQRQHRRCGATGVGLGRSRPPHERRRFSVGRLLPSVPDPVFIQFYFLSSCLILADFSSNFYTNSR